MQMYVYTFTYIYSLLIYLFIYYFLMDSIRKYGVPFSTHSNLQTGSPRSISRSKNSAWLCNKIVENIGHLIRPRTPSMKITAKNHGKRSSTIKNKHRIQWNPSNPPPKSIFCKETRPVCIKAHLDGHSKWVFPKIGGKPPKWMAYNGKTLLTWMIWGEKRRPIFGNTQIPNSCGRTPQLPKWPSLERQCLVERHHPHQLSPSSRPRLSPLSRLSPVRNRVL